MKRRIIPILAMLVCLGACAEKALPEEGRFVAVSFTAEGPSLWAVGTRSILTDPEIETKVTCVTLAAYSNGALEASGYYISPYSMVLSLVPDRSYTVYALVNMGDLRSSLPAAESGLETLAYTIPSYTIGSTSIDTRGIPMSGSIEYTMGSGGSTVIPVRRLLAKVTANLSCDWDEATITSVKVYGMNGRLHPFGDSAVQSASDMLPEVEYCAGGGVSAGTYVFYVPENRQGTVAGITDSADKSHERNATVNAMRERLTYLETSVSTTGNWTGTVTYRSYLGRNATSDFDIEGNARYIWTVVFREDELQESTWKRETDLSFTTYEQELLLSPASATLEVGYTRTYRAFIRTWTVVNGVRTTYTDSVLKNTSLMWSVSNTSRAMVNASGQVTGVSDGTVTVTARYTPSGTSALIATASLTVVSGGNNWDDSWDDQGEIILP
ncbi:MAG: DUF4906 domain-containing protein [Bacteroidales bacterium]|nr:DUF4906 domain-containing protein [Bacteroidales bacterium]